ncbi:MAG: type II toxin-antitoxin system VapC family toxin [Planctomycetota bacterium]
MPSVYLETSIFGYLASRTSADLIVAGNQRLTNEWWDNHRETFELFVSQAVVAECSAGDAVAASERLVFLDGIPILDIDDATRDLAKTLLAEVRLPPKADVDALHIAVSAMNSMDYLLTWNCKHIANPSLRRRIEAVLVSSGVTPPVICTPQELINV